jgi:hypothetical protein
MNAQPGDDDGVTGIVYVLRLEPAYRHARHHIGWTAGDVGERVAIHFHGAGSPLIRAAVADVDVHAGATLRGSRTLERRLERWHKTTQFCPTCCTRPRQAR